MLSIASIEVYKREIELLICLLKMRYSSRYNLDNLVLTLVYGRITSTGSKPYLKNSEIYFAHTHFNYKSKTLEHYIYLKFIVLSENTFRFYDKLDRVWFFRYFKIIFSFLLKWDPKYTFIILVTEQIYHVYTVTTINIHKDDNSYISNTLCRYNIREIEVFCDLPTCRKKYC